MSLRIPSPKALTKPEAYLAYKAGILSRDELKQNLYNPLNNYEGWLAKWCGLLETYPTNEDGTPQCLTDEEGLLAYLCGVTDRYPASNSRPDDARISAYIRYLVSARYIRPDHPLNREEFYLSLIKTQFIPSGNPSSDIEIDGTAKAPFVDVKMYGDTFQQSYTGKNLLSLQGIASPIGITGTVKDGSIVTVTGTVGSSASDNRIAKLVAPLSAGTYTLTIDRPCDHVINLTVGDAIFRLSAGETSKTATLTADTASGGLFWGVAANTTYNETFKLQLVAGSTPDYDYEPYVGGQPSPSPDYPQPIQTVTGRQVVNVKGKNLFVPPNSATSRGVTFTKNEDGSFNISGKAVGGEALCSIFTDINLKDGESLTLSSNVAISTGVVYRVEAYNGNSWLVSLISQVTTMPKTITIPQNATRLRYSIGLLEGREVNLTNVTFQLEKGTATAYEPYSSNDYEINLGKNLFNRNDVVKGIPANTDGSIVSTTSVGRTSDYIPVTPNTTYSHTGHPLGWANVAWYKADKSFIKRNSDVTTVTSPSEAAYARVSCAQGNLDTCQFEAGEPTDYAPYFEPIELCKLGTYQDYIYKDGDDWKVHKATSKATFASSSNWSKSNSTANNLYINQLSGLALNSPLACNKLTVYESATLYSSSTIGLCYNTTVIGTASIRIGVGIDSGIDTIGKYGSWLAQTMPTVYYALATPTDTTITDTTLIAQLEALKNGGAENGTTYIKVNATDPNLPAKLYVEAPKYD